ncbi:hypothetical protein [Marmoricola sp. URHA0025 HA25]
MSDEVIYARKPVSRRGWAIPFALLLAFTAVMVVKDLPDFRGITVVAAIGGFSPILLIWLLTLWSINRYGAVTLTRETLRVGRDRVPVAQIEPQWVRMLAQRADPSLAQRLGTSATTLQLPGERQVDRGRGRLLGGAYGTTLGDDLVTLELRDDGLGNRRVSVPTRDRRGLLLGLLTALDATA